MADIRGQNSQTQGDVAHDSADANYPIKQGGRAQDPLVVADEVTDNDRTDALYDMSGRLATWPGDVYETAVIESSTLGDNEIIAAKAGKRIAIWNYHLVSVGTTNLRLNGGVGGPNGTAQPLVGNMNFQAREGIAVNGGTHPVITVGIGTALIMELSAAIEVDGSMSYSYIK